MATSAESQVASGFTQMSPGILVQFAVFVLFLPATMVMGERKGGTTQRLLTTLMTRRAIVAGHALAIFVLAFVEQFFLVLVGHFALGVPYLHDPLATLLVVTGLSAFAAALGLFISAIAKSEENVVMYTLIMMFALSALGGAWFPLDVAGKTFSQLGHLLPTAWAMDGFQNIILRGLPTEAALLPTAILLAYAVVFFGLAVWRLRFE
ncbi:MAG: ABC transporter permease [Chloroflexota bacterium]